VVGFYNVENLFDTINDPNIDDEEFLPSAEKKHNSAKYCEKLGHLARVINVFSPDVLGLAEIENKGTLINLADSIAAQKGKKYEIAHIVSKDKRGIDVAFLYNPDKFKLLEIANYEVKMPADPDFITRDIIHLIGLANNQRLHVFGNHWPSRSGGQEASEPNRIQAAATLKNTIDALIEKEPLAQIIIMGDFNDEPFDKSIASVLGADSLLSGNNRLFNTSYYFKKLKQGTYNYKSQWNILDQIIVSRSLLTNNTENWRVESPYQAKIVKEEFMLYTTKAGEMLPSRSYGGNTYFGGYSDHLPTYIVLVK